MERTELAEGYTISRLVIGCWQLSEGHARRAVETQAVFEAFSRMVEAGLTTFDCADIYTGVEELMGEFCCRHRRSSGSEGKAGLQIHTKFVPDLDALPGISKGYVERIIDRSLKRLGTERLDLVQFAWWNYAIPRYVETAQWLTELQSAGKIRHLGATNFDVARLKEMAEAGVQFVSHQVQYSLLDHRPEGGTAAAGRERSMVEFCRERSIKLLCYGTVAGGFLSGRYVGAAEPQEPLANRSLTKYKLIIHEFGGWALYQELLEVLQNIAGKHGVGVGTVAIRYVLDRPGVAAAIVGGWSASHLEDNLRLFGLRLDQEELDSIRSVIDRCEGPEGDVYALERKPDGAHAAIMRYNLNRSSDA